MKTRQLIEIIMVRKFSQRVHFQINLPRDAKRIVSLHHEVRMITVPAGNMFPPPQQGSFLNRNVVAGELRLQAFEKAGWFYNGEVFLTDRNWDVWEYPTLLFFTPQPYIHAFNNYAPLEIKVGKDTTVISGIFKDTWGARIATNIQYDVKLYLEIELNTKENDN